MHYGLAVLVALFCCYLWLSDLEPLQYALLAAVLITWLDGPVEAQSCYSKQLYPLLLCAALLFTHLFAKFPICERHDTIATNHCKGLDFVTAANECCCDGSTHMR